MRDRTGQAWKFLGRVGRQVVFLVTGEAEDLAYGWIHPLRFLDDEDDPYALYLASYAGTVDQEAYDRAWEDDPSYERLW